MRHEQREVLIVAPEGIHLIDGSIDVERFLNIDSPSAVEWRLSREPEFFAAARGAHQETSAEGLEDTPESSASREHVQRQQPSGNLPPGAAAAFSRSLTRARAKRRVAEALEITDAQAVPGRGRNNGGSAPLQRTSRSIEKRSQLAAQALAPRTSALWIQQIYETCAGGNAAEKHLHRHCASP